MHDKVRFEVTDMEIIHYGNRIFFTIDISTVNYIFAGSIVLLFKNIYEIRLTKQGGVPRKVKKKLNSYVIKILKTDDVSYEHVIVNKNNMKFTGGGFDIVVG